MSSHLQAIIHSTICNHLQSSKPHLVSKGNMTAMQNQAWGGNVLNHLFLCKICVFMMLLMILYTPKKWSRCHCTTFHSWYLILDLLRSYQRKSNTFTEFHFEFSSFVDALKELDDREEEAAENDMEEKSEHLTPGSTIYTAPFFSFHIKFGWCIPAFHLVSFTMEQNQPINLI